MPMPQIFRPYADSVARATLVTLLIGPFAAIGIAYWTMRSNYITDQTITLGQPVPFSHAHHVGGLGLDCRYCHSGGAPASRRLRGLLWVVFLFVLIFADYLSRRPY
jgi:hypothetical protein